MLASEVNVSDASLYEPIERDLDKSNQIVRPTLNYWQDAFVRFRKNPLAMICCVILMIYVVLAILGPFMTQYDYRTTNAKAMNQLPSGDHFFGTDKAGRDMWSRIWTGARYSLSISLIVALINQFNGIWIGGIAGYFGGKIDMLIMRLIDVLYGIPTLIIAILLMIAFGRNAGIAGLVAAMTALGWIGSARFIRGQVLQLKTSEYVLAARALGSGSMRIIFKHLVPNTMGLIITNVAMAIPSAIFTEAFLSFIGLGLKPPTPSWGILAREVAESYRQNPFQLFIVSIFICTTMLSFNLLGDGLRDALDPRMRGAK